MAKSSSFTLHPSSFTSSFFITLEGGEGAGKSTLQEALANEFSSKGYSVLKTREPGGSPLAEKIRQLLLGQEVTPIAELLLFLAARAEHIQEKIRPALEEGQVVICDRFFDSTIAYQAFARGLPMDDVEKLDQIARGGLVPDLTLLLDIDPEKAFKRIAVKGRDRLEREGLAFHKKVRSGFLFLAKRYPERIVVIDGSLPSGAVLEEALAAIEKKLS